MGTSHGEAMTTLWRIAPGRGAPLSYVNNLLTLSCYHETRCYRFVGIPEFMDLELDSLPPRVSLWNAIRPAWGYSRITRPDGTTSFGVTIDPVRLHAELQEPPDRYTERLTNRQIAAAYQEMTGQSLNGFPIDDNHPTVANVRLVASGMEQYFNQLQQTPTTAVAAAAEARTLPMDAPVEQRTRFIMSTPREPLESFEQTRDRLRHWAALRQTVEAVGGRVILMEPTRAAVSARRNLEIFTRDPVIVLDDRRIALVPSDDALPRNGEGALTLSAHHIPDMVNELRQRDYTIRQYSGYAEGGDVVYDRQRRLILVGYDAQAAPGSQRFTAEDAASMARQTGCTVMRVPRTSQHFYHLDTAIGVLPDGQYLINPTCTDQATLTALRNRVGADNIVEVDRNERRYVSNMVTVGNTLIMPACSPALANRLSDLGYTTVTPETVGLPAGAWDIQRGSVHCMTQEAMLNIRSRDPDAYASLLRTLIEEGPSQTSNRPAAIASTGFVPPPLPSVDMGTHNGGVFSV
jgi:N-dimethylarginine dimethylaminohydrolase